jgi:hypothetical protein
MVAAALAVARSTLAQALRVAVAERITVGRLRVRTLPLHSAAAPARVASLLAGAELRPRQLAPGALLCVRRLADPAPGTLRLDGASVRPPDRWREQVVDSLDEALGRAARPAREAVPAGAESVLFADRAELLAALASVWCDGTAVTHWWWRSVAGRASPRDAVPTAWAESPEAAPAALELLSREGRAVAFARQLDDRAAAAIARGMAARHGLRGVVAALAAAPVAGGTSPGGARVQAPDMTAARASPTGRWLPHDPGAASSRAPVWEPLVPEAGDRALSASQGVVLALGLILRRAQWLAREPGFGSTLVRWAATRPPAAPAHRAERQDEPAVVRRCRAAPPRRRGGGTGAVASAPATDRRAASRPCRWEPRGPSESGPPWVDGDVKRSPAQLRLTPDALPGTSPSAAAPPTHDEIAVRTELGGLVMLVNVAIALELYGDFTSPLRPGIRLDPWHFVIATGSRLLGRSSAHHRRDPIWELLAHLAGDRRLGAGFRPADSWRLPPAWLEAFAEDRRPWRVSHGKRVIIRHPARFVVVDVPAGTDPARQVRRALTRYGSPATLAGAPFRATPRHDPLDRWLDRLVPYLRARLRLAIGGDPADQLLAIPATVRASPERLDVEISLSRLPVEVRLAGLDRDPGWFPAAGRHIAFHFA